MLSSVYYEIEYNQIAFDDEHVKYSNKYFVPFELLSNHMALFCNSMVQSLE